MKTFDRQWVSVFALLALVGAAVVIDRTWFASNNDLEVGRQTVSAETTSDLSDGAGAAGELVRHPHCIQARTAPAVKRALALLAEGDSTDQCVRRAGDTMNGRLNFKIGSGATANPFPIDFLYDQKVRWCSTATCTNYVYETFATSNSMVGFQSNSGVPPSITAAQFVASTNSQSGFKENSTGWLELHGDTVANVEASVPSSGYGALNYDTTNTKMRVYENGAWNSLVTTNPDAGAPFGPSIAFSAHNISTGANLKPLAGIAPRGRYRAESLGWNIETAGTGAGNATAIIRDIGGAANLCTATFLCALTTGSVTTATCSPWTAASAAGNEIDIRLDCSACTTCPVMNLTASLNYMPGT